MIRALPDFAAVQLADMESSLRELKKLVSWGWTYAVIWKIGHDHRTPVWHQSYFNERVAGALPGPAQRFESIFRHCQFTPVRPGYAYVAWMRQSPLWWTRLMEPVLTDRSKESFLSEVGIQTLVCFPGRATLDGTGYCVELASTALIATDVRYNVNSTTSAHGLSSEERTGSSKLSFGQFVSFNPVGTLRTRVVRSMTSLGNEG